jgi:transposase
MSEQTIYEKQEELRARWVIDKAQRNNLNVLQTLTDHGVSRSLIERLTGETVQMSRKAKKNKEQIFREWLTEHANQEMAVEAIAESFEVSIQTAYKIMRESPTCFVKARRGVYEVRDVYAERELAKATKPSS